MEKEFVPYELAVKLKALGFNEPCFGFYLEDGTWTPASYSKEGTVYPSNTDLLPGWYTAPLFQQAFRWIREKHGLFSSCDISNFVNKTYGYVINSSNPPYYLHDVHNLKSIEEAEIACLTKLIEIVENR